VTYEVSGAKEVIRDGETGFIIAQGDIEGAAEKLAYLAANPEASRRIGACACSAVSAEYRESRMIRNKLEFYYSILGPPHPDPLPSWRGEGTQSRTEERA